MNLEKCAFCGRPIDPVTERPQRVQTSRLGQGLAHELCYLRKRNEQLAELEVELQETKDELHEAEVENASLDHQLWMERQVRWELSRKLEAVQRPSLLIQLLDRILRRS